MAWKIGMVIVDDDDVDSDDEDDSDEDDGER